MSDGYNKQIICKLVLMKLLAYVRNFRILHNKYDVVLIDLLVLLSTSDGKSLMTHIESIAPSDTYIIGFAEFIGAPY
jgi:hypothetical protein